MLGRTQSAITKAKLAQQLAPSDATITKFLTQLLLDADGKYLPLYI